MSLTRCKLQLPLFHSFFVQYNYDLISELGVFRAVFDAFWGPLKRQLACSHDRVSCVLPHFFFLVLPNILLLRFARELLDSLEPEPRSR